MRKTRPALLRGRHFQDHLISCQSRGHSHFECAAYHMDTDDAIVNAFIERLDNRDLNGHFNVELSKLTYAQLLRVSEILAKRAEKQQRDE